MCLVIAKFLGSRVCNLCADDEHSDGREVRQQRHTQRAAVGHALNNGRQRLALPDRLQQRLRAKACQSAEALAQDFRNPSR